MAIDRQYLTIEQVAQRLHVHVQTIRRYVHDGRLPAYKLGHTWRISEEDLGAFLSQQRRGSVFVAPGQTPSTAPAITDGGHPRRAGGGR